MTLNLDNLTIQHKDVTLHYSQMKAGFKRQASF